MECERCRSPEAERTYWAEELCDSCVLVRGRQFDAEGWWPRASRPRLVDLYCGAGGAAMGYFRAGFEVVGVDVEHQPHYLFEFTRADALGFDLSGFDAVHASPPCQRWSVATAMAGDPESHPDLIDATRELLVASGLPYVIENVRGAPLRPSVVLCGSHFGLPVRRHRYFETNWLAESQAACSHDDEDLAFDHRGSRRYGDVMGCTWMPVRSAFEAVPPPYTEWLGERLMEHLGAVKGDSGELAAEERAALAEMRNLPRWTHCPQGHEVTTEYQRPDGRRRCAECERGWSRERMRKLRAGRRSG